jgi:microcystin-dependent protein
MATATIPNSFTNGTNADANLVNANFSYLSSWLNTNVIQPNAANFSVFPTLPSSAPTSDYQAVHKSYVDLFMPAGVITQYVGTAAPAGWRLCDGGEYNAADATYARLWAAIGTTYGGSGINAFRVPDLRGRVPVGYGAGAGLTARTLNDKAGTETHALTIAELAAHTHGIDHDHGSQDTQGDSAEHTHGINLPNTPSGLLTNVAPSAGTGIIATQLDYTQSTTSGRSAGHTHQFDILPFGGTSGPTGSGNAHNNMQPFIVVSYIIKL